MNELKTEIEVEQYTPIKKKKPVFIWVTLAIILIFTLTSAVLSYEFVIDTYNNGDKDTMPIIEAGKEIPIDIPLGSSASAIAEILDQEGVINHPFLFKLLSKINGYDSEYKSGTHIVSKDLSYDEIMFVLSSKPVGVPIIIPEGYTYKQITDTLIKGKLINQEKFNSAANTESYDFKFLKDLPQRENKLEGYLFPDTYEFNLKSGEREIINRMLSRFDEKFKPEYYARAKELNMTIDNIIILASIIEREAKAPEDRKTIAGVFYNRLNGKYRAPNKLESCATIQYILGEVKLRLTEKDTQIEHPYNTYRNAGLPPGPICSPGEESIKAALYPEDNKYAFFVAKADGTHYFSKTYSEHLAAIKKYGVN